jgi:3-hydroxybutyryl-CoA dehydrogenase
MSLPDRIGVIGGGTMGAGIAHTFAQMGTEVLVLENSTDTADTARHRITEGITRAAERDTDLDAFAMSERITVVTDYSRLASVQLVIEAVPEVPAFKTTALVEAERNMPADAWLATNTSSLSVTDLAQSLSRPERFCGMHFFNPVPRSALVEIVRTEHSAPELIDLAAGWVAKLGKTPIVVRDSPGFASSRLGLALALEAMRMLEDDVASAEDIDAAMVLGYRHATGPLKTTDLVGLDVRLGIAEHLAATVGPRFEPPQILRDKVAAGDLGRKSGRGFFGYTRAAG